MNDSVNLPARTLRIHHPAPAIRIAATLATLFLGLLVGASRVLAQTDIAYRLPRAGRISLAIYNTEGRQLRTLLAGETQTVGKHTLPWDGLNRLGRAMPVGSYSWKLLLNDGLEADWDADATFTFAASRDDWSRAFGVVTVPDNAGKLVILLKAEHQLRDGDSCRFHNVGIYRMEPTK